MRHELLGLFEIFWDLKGSGSKRNRSTPRIANSEICIYIYKCMCLIIMCVFSLKTVIVNKVAVELLFLFFKVMKMKYNLKYARVIVSWTSDSLSNEQRHILCVMNQICRKHVVLYSKRFFDGCRGSSETLARRLWRHSTKETQGKYVLGGCLCNPIKYWLVTNIPIMLYRSRYPP